MGAFKSKREKIDIEKLPKLHEETDYQIKTRSPKPTNWRLNIMRGKREDELRNEAYYLARRKCYDKAKSFENCEKIQGKFWTSFNCQQEYQLMSSCFNREFDVEMDKLRRDIKVNNEWWWRSLYDEDGEIGEQLEWRGESWVTTKFRDLYQNLFK